MIRSLIASLIFLIPFSASLSFAAEQAPLSPPWTGKVPPKESHPCLFFSPNDILLLKERITREPYNSWFAMASRHSTDKAFVWLLKGDDSQAAAARSLLVNNPVPRDSRHQYIEPSSHSFFNWILTYDCLASWSGLSPEDHKNIRDKLANEAEFYYQAMTEIKGGQNYGNQRTLGASALGMCALVLSEYRGTAHTPQQWLDMALWAIKCPENFWFWRPDGMFVEGYGYTNYMGLTFAPFLGAYTRLSGEDLFSDPTISAWLRYQAYFFLPDGRHINFGTSNFGEDREEILFPLFANRTAGKENAGLYAWAAHPANGNRLHSNLLVPAIGLCDDQVRPEAEKYPYSAVFTSCQQMVMKDSWADNLTGVWITGKGSGWMVPKFYNTYSHADPTSFIFYSGGEFLAVDAGYTHWHGPDCQGPESHNLVLIDGKGPAPATLAELKDAVISDRADAVTIETEYADHQVRRVFIFGEKRVLIVADFLSGKGSHEYLFQLHSPVTVGKAEAVIGLKSVVWPGFDAIANKLSPTTLNTFFAGPVKVEQIPSHWRPTDEVPVDNIAIGAKWQGEDGAALLSALFAQQPEQPKVTVKSESNAEFQRLEARTDTWVIRALARQHLGALKEGNASATAQLLVTCRPVRNGKIGEAQWVYVWGAEKLELPRMSAGAAKGLNRGLLLWDGKVWKVQGKESGT